MPIFAPQQIERYAQQANLMPGLPARQTVQSAPVPNPVTGQEGYQPLEEKSGLPWGYKAGIVGANLFDAATTRHALSSNNKAYESNPLMAPLANSTPGFMAAKGGFGLLQAYAMNNLAKEHPKAARIASLASMAIPGIVGAMNLNKGK